MAALEEFLRAHSGDRVIPWSVEHEAARRFDLPLWRVEDVIMELGMMPSRYQRNGGSLSAEDQRRLLHGKVAVIGCGGLGGYVIEVLARIGIGNLVIADPDVIDEHNVNRQIVATVANVGTPKVVLAEERVRMVNPAVAVESHAVAFESDRREAMLGGVDVVIDALDSIPARLDLEDACEVLSIPLIHGAIAGWHAQVTTILPGDRTLRLLYGAAPGQKGREEVTGIPSFTPLVAAGMQAAEACKVVLGRQAVLRRKILSIDLVRMTTDLIDLTGDNT